MHQFVAAVSQNGTFGGSRGTWVKTVESHLVGNWLFFKVFWMIYSGTLGVKVLPIWIGGEGSFFFFQRGHPVKHRGRLVVEDIGHVGTNRLLLFKVERNVFNSKWVSALPFVHMRLSLQIDVLKQLAWLFLVLLLFLLFFGHSRKDLGDQINVIFRFSGCYLLCSFMSLERFLLHLYLQISCSLQLLKLHRFLSFDHFVLVSVLFGWTVPSCWAFVLHVPIRLWLLRVCNS